MGGRAVPTKMCDDGAQAARPMARTDARVRRRIMALSSTFCSWPRGYDTGSQSLFYHRGGAADCEPLAVARLGACLTNDRRREGATHASHGRPWMVAPGLRGAGTAQRNDPHRADFCDHFASIVGTM